MVSTKRRRAGFGLFEFLVLGLATAVVIGLVIGLATRTGQAGREADCVSLLGGTDLPIAPSEVASGPLPDAYDDVTDLGKGPDPHSVRGSTCCSGSEDAA